jgi:hypothetical protein
MALAPIEHGRFGAAPSSHIGGIGLDLMLAMLTPRKSQTRVAGQLPEHQRWVGVHRLLTGQ